MSGRIRFEIKNWYYDNEGSIRGIVNSEDEMGIFNKGDTTELASTAILKQDAIGDVTYIKTADWVYKLVDRKE